MTSSCVHEREEPVRAVALEPALQVVEDGGGSPLLGRRARGEGLPAAREAVGRAGGRVGGKHARHHARLPCRFGDGEMVMLLAPSITSGSETP